MKFIWEGNILNSLNRAVLNIIRNPGKNLILFLLILFLGCFLSSSISIRNAINQTGEKLNAKLPPIATLSWNYEKAGFYHGAEIQWEKPTIEMIEEVGNLPYVKSYDFSSKIGLYSRELNWVKPLIKQELLPDWITVEELEKIQQGDCDKGGRVEYFGLKGVNNSNPTDIQSGFISLKSGRFMTQEEIDKRAPVIVISQSFANANHLMVGSEVVLENIVYDYAKMVEDGITYFYQYWHLADYVIGNQSLTFEVIGIFEVEQEFYYPDDIVAVQIIGRETEFHNQFYVSNKVIEAINDFIFETKPTDFYENMIIRDDLTNFSPIFILNDPRDIKDFSEEVKEILPEFWEVQTLSGIFGKLTNTMVTMQWFAKLIFWGTIISTVAILSLLITLFLRQRKHEIGVYMALGEKKIRIMFQVVLEVLFIALVAAPFSLFAGHYFSSQLSNLLIEKDLIDQQKIDQGYNLSNAGIPFDLELFNPGAMTIEEMVDSYDTSLDIATTVTFISSGFIVILLSIAIPILYMIRLNPRKVLM